MSDRKKKRVKKSAGRSTVTKPVRPKRKPAARSTPAPFLQSRSPLSEIPPEENLYRDLFHESRDALIVTRPDGQIIEVNQTLLDLSGYTREEIQGMSSPDFYDNPADRTRLLREIEEKGFVRDCEITFKRKDGTKRDCLFTVSARRAPDGSVEGHLGIVRDITERKLVQSALRDSEKRYRLLLEAAPDPIMGIDREGRIRLVNKQTENVLGYSREELLGQPVEMLLPERFRGHHPGHRANYFANPHVRSMGSGTEFYARRKDGSEFPVDISLSPLETGEGTMVVCSLRDITEQEKSRKKLEEQTVFLNGLIENTPLATVVLDPQHRVLMCNPAFEYLFQYAQEEILGADIDELIVPEELRSEGVEFTTSSLAGAAVNFYSQRRCKDGSLVEVEVHGVPLVVRGEMIGLYALYQDVTERKRAEEALRASEERFSKAFHASPVSMSLTCVEDGRILDINENFLRLSGYTREEVLGRTAMDLGFWPSSQERDRAINLLREQGSVKNFEGQFRIKSGELRLYSYSAEKITIGGEERLLSVVEDITERKRAEEALKNSEERFSKAFHSGPVSMAITRKEDGRVLDVNEDFARGTGYAREQIIGRTGTDLKFWRTPEIREEVMQQLEKEGRIRNYEEYFYNKLGEKRWYSFSAEQIVIEGEERVLSAVTDITERKKAEAALQLSQFSIDSSSDAAIWVSPEGKILFVSDAACQLTGYSRAELLTMGVWDLNTAVTPDNWPARWEGERAAGTQRFEAEYRAKDGRVFPVEISTSYLDVDGKEYSFGFVRDITERKQAEEALRLSQFSIDRSSDAAYWVSSQGRFLFANDAACRMLGYAREELLEMNVWDISLTVAGPKQWEAQWEATKKAVFLRRESRHRASDGRIFPVEISINYLNFNGTEYSFAFARDITERKQADAALRESEEKYRDLIENANDIVYTIDLEGNFTSFNKAGERISGFTQAEAVGMNVAQVVAPESIDTVRLSIRRKLEGEKVPAYELDVLSRDGQRVTLEVNTRIIFQEGKPSGIQGIARDITERKRAELQLEGERQVLEILANGASLPKVLEYQARALEQQLPGALCSVLLLDEDGRHLLHGAAPSLPAAYNQAIDGMTIGDGQGSCGTAAFKAEQVVVTDVMTDPLWVDFRQLAQEHGLRACWSTPIISSKGKVLGTFAVYHRETHTPTAHEREVVGRAVHLAGVAIESRKSEEALRRSEADLAKAQRVAHVGSWVYDVVENKVHWSDENYRVFGFEPQSLEASYDVFIQCVHPDDRKSIEQAIRATLEEGVPYSIEHRIVWPDGTVRIVSELAEVVREESGKPLRMIGTCQDITERKKAEEALSQSEKKYGMVLQNVDEIVYVATHTPGNGSVGWSVEFVSPHVQKVLGYRAGDFLQDSKLWETLLHPDDKEPSLEAMRKLLADKESQTRSYRIQKKDSGEYVWLEDRLVPQIDDQGDVVGIFGVARDVTERRNLEERLLQSQKMEAVGQLAGGVAHDFNNLLMVIRGYTDLIGGRGELEGSLQENLAEIRKAADRATSLTQQLLAFSRKQVLHPELISLNDVVANMERMLRRLIGENIELQTLVAPELGKVKADPSQIEQVILNLAINARDAMNEGGRLVLETANVELDDVFVRRQPGSRPGPYVLLRVVDTGAGMDAETVSHIFEPFFTTKATGKGTGLGLATVYGIVKQSSAYIVVSSEEGKGTVFEIYLPRVEEEAAEPEPERAAIVAGGGSETVLVVEDEGAVCKLSCDYLTSRGYNVLCAGDGLEALQVAERHRGPIHLLLTDVVMPGINGQELARRLNEERPDMKVMYVSGYIDDAVAQAFQKQPGTVFLQKPFPLETLGRQVREILKA